MEEKGVVKMIIVISAPERLVPQLEQMVSKYYKTWRVEPAVRFGSISAIDDKGTTTTICQFSFDEEYANIKQLFWLKMREKGLIK